MAAQQPVHIVPDHVGLDGLSDRAGCIFALPLTLSAPVHLDPGSGQVPMPVSGRTYTSSLQVNGTGAMPTLP
ncbi:unnamed protein product [Protopolystoma xenopodis]|uniref:Uncharacterized protein n=1 Tax=Protopolystoma xenopodis TaxID=117903 RepID=A0A3S5A0F5_9PLAT|nr:unnamed protein product [Protopolystoma xenopodis]